MGDRLGTPGAVGITLFLIIDKKKIKLETCPIIQFLFIFILLMVTRIETNKEGTFHSLFIYSLKKKKNFFCCLCSCSLDFFSSWEYRVLLASLFF
jgi:hypothetical protein